MKNEIIEVGGTKWKVREAKCREHALNEIAMARVTGSVGGRCIEQYNGVTTVLADFIRLNDDGSECQPG